MRAIGCYLGMINFGVREAMGFVCALLLLATVTYSSVSPRLRRRDLEHARKLLASAILSTGQRPALAIPHRPKTPTTSSATTARDSRPDGYSALGKAA